MAHELFDGRYFGRQAAWHGLGTVVNDRRVSAVEAIDLARLDYEVIKLPMHITLPSGETMPSDKYALTRMPTADDPNHEVFSVVSGDYTILPNRDVFNALNPLSELWAVETAGAIEKGKRAFMSLEAGMHEIKGHGGKGSDPVQMFFLVVNDFDGATKIRFTPIRVVCKNTLSMSERRFSVTANVRHKGQAMLEYGAMLKLVAELQGVQAEAMALFDRMAQTIIDPEDAAAIINAAYPLPKKAKKLDLLTPVEVETGGAISDDADAFMASLKSVAARHDYNTERMRKHQAEIGRLLEWYNDNHPEFGNTVWNAYNAVTDYVDHVQSGGGRAESAVFGPRAGMKIKALEMAASLVN